MYLDLRSHLPGSEHDEPLRSGPPRHSLFFFFLKFAALFQGRRRAPQHSYLCFPISQLFFSVKKFILVTAPLDFCSGFMDHAAPSLSPSRAYRSAE